MGDVAVESDGSLCFELLMFVFILGSGAGLGFRSYMCPFTRPLLSV